MDLYNFHTNIIWVESAFVLFFTKIIHPLLKFVRGEHLSSDHWLDMFRLLKLPRGTTLEKLIFGDIIKVADEIIANADAIKV